MSPLASLFFTPSPTHSTSSHGFHPLKFSLTTTIMSTMRDHILLVPKPLIGLRFVQLVTAVAILGLSAYGVTYLSFDGDSLTLFTVSGLFYSPGQAMINLTPGHCDDDHHSVHHRCRACNACGLQLLGYFGS